MESVRHLRITLPLLAALSAAAAWGQGQAVLVDRSGSVKAYYDSGLFPEVGGKILSSLDSSRPVRIYGFGTEVTPVADLRALGQVPYGANTHLDRALERAIRDRHVIAWMITDNIQDRPQDPTAGNTAVFYQTLRGDAVQKVVIFPFLQPAGLSGLAVYALLLAPEADAAFESGVRAFLEQTRSRYRTEALRMKPLGRDTVEVVLSDAGGKRPVFDEGKPLRQVVEMRFRSRFEHLRIVDSRIRPVQVTPTFGPGSLLEPEKREVEIRPDRVTALGPQEETGQVFRVDIDLGKVRLKRDLASVMKAAWGGKSGEDVTLKVPLAIEVPQENFRFRDNFLQVYHAPTLEAAKASGKVYGIGQLPILLSDAATSVVTEVPCSFRVNYPWWPSVAAVAALLLALLLLAGAAYGLVKMLRGGGRKKQWRVEAFSEFNIPLEASVDGEGRILVRGDELGSIRGNKFEPAGDVQVVAGAPGGEILDGAVWRLQTGRGVVKLGFREAGAEEPAPPGGDDYVPEER
jgi:hypothetical protein